MSCALGTGFAACGADQNGDQITSPISTTSTRTATGASSTTKTTLTTAGGAEATATASTTTSTQSLPGSKRPVVLLGDMNTDEQFVLGQLYLYALRAAGYTVAVSRNIGPTSVTDEAIKEHTLDVFPDYISNLDGQLVAPFRSFGSEAEALTAARRYARRHGLVLLDPTPFSNTTGLAVTAAYARSLNVTSLGALARGASPVVGVPLEWETAASGLPLIERKYHLAPTYVRELGVGLQYKALDDGSVQAAYAASTDPQLDSSAYVFLADPLHAGGFGNVVPVTTKRVIDAEGPAFVRTLNRVDELLTLSAIRGLNAEVQLDGVDPSVAAQEFLQAHHLIPEPSTPGSD